MRTHCKHGHEFTPENTRTIDIGLGRTTRRCRACQREQDRRRSLAGCHRGHAFTAVNTYTYPSGKRACLACRRLREQGITPEHITSEMGKRAQVSSEPLRGWLSARTFERGDLSVIAFEGFGIVPKVRWRVLSGRRNTIALAYVERIVVGLGGDLLAVEEMYPPELYPIPHAEVHCARCDALAHAQRSKNIWDKDDLSAWSVEHGEAVCGVCAPKSAALTKHERTPLCGFKGCGEPPTHGLFCAAHAELLERIRIEFAAEEVMRNPRKRRARHRALLERELDFGETEPEYEEALAA